MKSIFIAYREDDAKAWALLLRDELVNTFGAESVFLDKDALRSGDWLGQLRQAMAKCKVVLIVMGKRWLTASDDRGRRRLEDPMDVHRHEVAMALANAGLTVIPVLVDGAKMPRAEDLSEDIRALTAQEAWSVADAKEHRDVDMQSLADEISRLAGLRARHRDLSFAKAALRRGARQALLVALVSAVLLMALEVGLGWKLDAQERLFVVTAVVVVAIAIGSLRGALRGVDS